MESRCFVITPPEFFWLLSDTNNHRHVSVDIHRKGKIKEVAGELSDHPELEA